MSRRMVPPGTLVPRPSIGNALYTAMPRIADREMPVATVLVVEDNAQVRRTIVRSLRSHGYAVIEACDSYEAFEIIESRPGTVSLVVTDLVLSGVNGLDLAKSIERTEPGIKVVFMSAYGDDPWGLRQKVPEGKFLAKPFSLSDLLEMVRNTLGV